MKKIEAEIIADSLSPQGNRITTFLLTYPRFIHSELLTHRVFSRNSASSRAIPFEKMVKMVEEDPFIPFEEMVKMVEEDPFIPIAWQRDHKGMQGSEYAQYPDTEDFKVIWLEARDNAVKSAQLAQTGRVKLTKQLCNRLLEPFMWHTVLVTATEWDNFFELRCPQYTVNWYPSRRPEALEPTQACFKSRKDAIEYTEGECDNWKEQDWRDSNESQAEIHIQALAEAMWDAMNESKPKELEAGEWHIPFGDRLVLNFKNNSDDFVTADDLKFSNTELIKIATARCARLSYMTFDGEINYEKDIALHDHLLSSRHMSPFEHCARAMSNEEYYSFVKGKENIEYFEEEPDIYTFKDSSYGWCNNFKGFIQYRYLVENSL